jgi:NADH:ubiquinone oxidoreductase subunit 6 (subunit J)
MSYLVILVVFGAIGVAIVFIILAWQNDVEEQGQSTRSNCGITIALIAVAIMVLLVIIYLLTPIGRGK